MGKGILCFRFLNLMLSVVFIDFYRCRLSFDALVMSPQGAYLVYLFTAFIYASNDGLASVFVFTHIVIGLEQRGRVRKPCARVVSSFTVGMIMAFNAFRLFWNLLCSLRTGVTLAPYVPGLPLLPTYRGYPCSLP